MKPRIVFVANPVTGPVHRAFSDRQAAFCGVVASSESKEWLNVWRKMPTSGRQCERCERSPLNGDVELKRGHYVPVENA